jgi:DNA-binding response OmpR family regulator
MMSPCILLVDNEVKLLVKLHVILSQAGYHVLTAYESRQAIYLAQAALPEVIVCNAKMSSLHDSDMRGTLARDLQAASIPFLFWSKPFTRRKVSGYAARRRFTAFPSLIMPS